MNMYEIGALVLGAAVLLPLLRIAVLKIKEIDAGLDATKRGFLLEFIDLAVRAAEQLGLAGKIEAEGAAKFRWVLDQVAKEAARLGLNITADELETMIESAVYSAFIESGLKDYLDELKKDMPNKG